MTHNHNDQSRDTQRLPAAADLSLASMVQDSPVGSGNTSAAVYANSGNEGEETNHHNVAASMEAPSTSFPNASSSTDVSRRLSGTVATDASTTTSRPQQHASPNTNTTNGSTAASPATIQNASNSGFRIHVNATTGQATFYNPSTGQRFVQQPTSHTRVFRVGGPPPNNDVNATVAQPSSTAGLGETHGAVHGNNGIIANANAAGNAINNVPQQRNTAAPVPTNRIQQPQPLTGLRMVQSGGANPPAPANNGAGVHQQQGEAVAAVDNDNHANNNDGNENAPQPPFRIHIHRNAAAALPNNVAQQPPPGIRVVRHVNNNGGPAGRNPPAQAAQSLPPLIPHVVQYKSPILPRENNDDDDSSNVTCSICWDSIQNPCGCGSCNVRFCYTCLLGVIASQQATATCPCCRHTLTRDGIVMDDDLQQVLDHATVTCPYCLGRLKLSDWKRHESTTCPQVVVSCRYKEWGCTWQGPKSALNKHEADECALCPLGGFIQQVRQDRAVERHAIHTLQHQMAASRQRVDVMAQSLGRWQWYKTEANVLDVLELVYVSTCLPVRFRFYKDLIWKQLHSTPHARAAIFNFLALLPTVIQSTRIVGSGFQLFQRCLNRVPEDWVDASLDVVLSVIVGVMCIMSVTAFLVDGNNHPAASLAWKRVVIPRLYIVQPGASLMQYAAGTSLLTLHTGCIMWNGPSRAILVWVLILLSSTIMPALVLTHLEGINGNINDLSPDKILTKGRAMLVLLFGMRYAMLVCHFGFFTCLDAMIVSALLLKTFEIFRTVMCLEDKLVDWTNVELSHILTLFAAYGATLYAAMEPPNDDQVVGFLVDGLLPGLGAFVALLLSNVCVKKCLSLGITLGKALVKTSSAVVQHPSAGLTIRKEHSLVGIAAFTCWFLWLGAIALS